MKQIHLGGRHGSIIGNYALVDDADFEWLNRWQWHASIGKGKYVYYAVRRVTKEGGQASIKMHRQILGLTDPNIQGDHDDGNGLNNQRHNIRIATCSQNCINRRNRLVKKTSKYRGVCYYLAKRKWCAAISINKKQIHIGYFTNEEEAAIAYNAAAIIHHGNFACLNTIKG